MEVWTVEWSYPSENDSNISVWDSEDKARKQACSEIIDDVQNWDFSDPDMRACAKRINDCIIAGDYKSALLEYNDWQCNSDYESQQFFSVTSRAVQSNSSNPSPIIFSDDDDDDDCCSCDCCGDDDCGGCEDEDDSDDDENYQASSPGAICRGPCGNRSDYAYADRRDGTHVCYQCKMMSQVFGGTVK